MSSKNLTPAYVGRFAPSPTGALHQGSLVTALASWLDARSVQGRWLLRIEDVDTPRVLAGAAAAICRLLEHYGLHWDGPVVYQQQRLEAYAAALAQLQAAGRLYRCRCSRKQLATAAPAPDGSRRYPGTCRNLGVTGTGAWRLHLEPGSVGYTDRLRGILQEDVAAAYGDVILYRADGYYAYPLAVVVDDAAAGVTDVVRGADLLPATARQVAVQQALGLPTPRYLHGPLVYNAQGQKLSKQTGAPALRLKDASPALVAALAALQHPAPADLVGAAPAQLLAWAVAYWNPARLICPPSNHQIIRHG